MTDKEERKLTREEKIELMHQAKQERIARQVSLQCAVELLKNTTKTYKDKIEEVKDLTLYFYNWIVHGRFDLTEPELESFAETIAESTAEKVIEKLKKRKEKDQSKSKGG
ncbi:hypothetical protein DRP07_00115 [Archaeoglobales archaeon]|nr:MAG: hypothetical protein DRP07_00115 [Archaeoglobales archaeon]